MVPVQRTTPPPRVAALSVAAALLLAACGSGGETAASDDDPPSVVESSTTTTLPDGPPPTTPGGVPVPEAIPIRSASYADVRAGRPVALRIPAIEVEAPIIPVGIEENGEMELPGAIEAGWFEPGISPAEDEGSSVIAAHVDWNGEEGPFFFLRDLEDGDRVEIDFDDGTTRSFRIVDTEQYSKEDLPIDDLFRRDGEAALALVTCGGSFDDRERSYADNVVAYAVPID